MKRFGMVVMMVVALLMASPLFAAQSLIETGGGALNSADRVSINANDTELYSTTSTNASNISTNTTNIGTNTTNISAFVMCYDVGDESTDLTAVGSEKTFRAPFAFTLTGIRTSVNTAPVGSEILVDLNEGGTTVLSTTVMIDASELTSTTATTPYVISDTDIADDAAMSIDIDQIGSSTAGKGLKVCIYGNK